MNPEDRLRALRDVSRWEGDAARPPGRRPPNDRLRVVVVSAAVLVAILVVVGALSRLPHAAAPASPSPTGSTAPTVDADAALPWDPSLVRSLRTYSRQEAAGVAACTSAHLQVWAQADGGGALGTYYQGVFVRNTGPLCSVREAGIRLDVGTVEQASLSMGGNGSELLPTGATERLQASHLDGCSADSVHLPTETSEPLRLAIGTTVRVLDARMPIAPGCTLSFTTWQMTQPASADEREPGFSTSLGVSIPPLPDTYRGAAFDYTVTLTNTGSKPVVVPAGTTFRQLVFDGAVTSITTADLNVGTGRTLAPGATLRLRMHVPAPGDPGASYWVAWYLADGTGGVAAQV